MRSRTERLRGFLCPLQTEPQIPWPELTKFIGQLNHDLRNHLNAVELQSAFLAEIVTDEEGRAEIKRLREMTGEMSTHLQRLSAALASIRPTAMRYLAAEFVEDLRAKLTGEKPETAAGVEWNNSLADEALEIDPYLVQEAFLELFGNAISHGRAEGPLVFESRPAGEAVEFLLREPKTKFEEPTENWGGHPVRKVRGGHYGLGLFRARSIFEAHHGTLHAHYDPSAATLTTTVALPRLAA
ncbi:MAG: hypothetical protein ACR2G0_10610 [Chthoniobacterales bacterium]